MRASAICLRAAIFAICATASRSCGNERERTARPADLGAALQIELEDVRSALDGALARSEVADGGELLANIGASWRGHRTRGGRHGPLRGVSRGAPGRRVAAARSAVNRIVVFAWRVRPQGAAFELATQAVEHARASGDDPSLAAALRRYAQIAMFLNRFDDAERALTEAEAIPGTSAHLRMQLLEARALLEPVSW